MKDHVRKEALATFKRILEPLTEMLAQAGLSVQDFTTLARECAVQTANDRMIKKFGRSSKSRISIITGLSRADVAQILAKQGRNAATKAIRHPVHKVLEGWAADARFVSKSGLPDVLSIFGSTRSFEKLMRLYGPAIPVRSMLDHLLELRAVEILSGDRLRLRKRIAAFSSARGRKISVVGERATNHLKSLVANFRSQNQLFDGAGLEIVNGPHRKNLRRRPESS